MPRASTKHETDNGYIDGGSSFISRDGWGDVISREYAI